MHLKLGRCSKKNGGKQLKIVLNLPQILNFLPTFFRNIYHSVVLVSSTCRTLGGASWYLLGNFAFPCVLHITLHHQKCNMDDFPTSRYTECWVHQCILCIVQFLCRYKKVSVFCTVGSRLRCQGCIGGGALCHSSLAVGTGGDLWDPRREPGQP